MPLIIDRALIKQATRLFIFASFCESQTDRAISEGEGESEVFGMVEPYGFWKGEPIMPSLLFFPGFTDPSIQWAGRESHERI